jgi:hypothetical protein
MSQYEAQLDRKTIFACFQAIRHPSRLPIVLRDFVACTRSYYSAQDVVDLERGELIELVSWTRKMTLKMTGSSLFLGLLVFLALMRSCHAQTVWTPDDFDWSTLKLAPDGQGLYLNLSAYPFPARSEHAALIATGRNGTIEGDAVVFLPFAIGFVWQTLKVVVGIGSVITAIQSCTTTGMSPLDFSPKLSVLLVRFYQLVKHTRQLKVPDGLHVLQTHGLGQVSKTLRWTSSARDPSSRHKTSTNV